MQTIEPEFNKTAMHLFYESEKADKSHSESTATDNLTLEMTNNPFADLIKRIKLLLDTGLQEDMREAFSLTKTALFDKVFDGNLEQTLIEKLDQIIDLIHKDRALGNAFTKSVHDVQLENTMKTAAAPKPKPVFQLAA